jgi:hypothetical protein
MRKRIVSVIALVLAALFIFSTLFFAFWGALYA